MHASDSTISTSFPTIESTMLSSKDPPRSPKDLSLRLAQPKDAASIAHLGAHIFSTTFGYSMPAGDLAHYLEENYTTSSILKDISSANVTLIVACNPADEVIGFSQLRRDSSEPCIEAKSKPIELQRLYVSPEHHGQGIARTLVDDVQRLAREEGCETMWLGVWEENFKAQKVYEKLGFVRCGEHDFVMGECVQTDWIMCKDL